VKLFPSGFRAETSASCTEFLGEDEEYITTAVSGKLPMAPVVEFIVAVQLEKVIAPKLARLEITLFTVGLSTIHSAESWLEAYVNGL
jgi:hypothetical protein